MNFNKFENDSYCVGDRHRSATVKVYGDITSKGGKVLFGYSQNVIEKNLRLLVIIL